MVPVGAFSRGHLNIGCGSFHARIPSLLCWIQSVVAPAAADEFPLLSNSLNCFAAFSSASAASAAAAAPAAARARTWLVF